MSLVRCQRPFQVSTLESPEPRGNAVREFRLRRIHFEFFCSVSHCSTCRRRARIAVHLVPQFHRVLTNPMFMTIPCFVLVLDLISLVDEDNGKPISINGLEDEGNGKPISINGLEDAHAGMSHVCTDMGMEMEMGMGMVFSSVLKAFQISWHLKSLYVRFCEKIRNVALIRNL